jgi:hypothetical protein
MRVLPEECTSERTYCGAYKELRDGGYLTMSHQLLCSPEGRLPEDARSLNRQTPLRHLHGVTRAHDDVHNRHAPSHLR